jgi:hypothetical protein
MLYLQLSFAMTKKICYLNVGWPGSLHEQRVFQNSVISNPHPFFSNQDYLIGDSAYTTTSYLFLAYKNFGGQVMLFVGQVFFNHLLSSLCTNIEHTIGIWKGRFPFLKNIHVNIASMKDMRHDIRLVKVSVVLHNLFVGSHSVPKTWLSV